MNEDLLGRAVVVLRGMAYEHRLRVLVLLRDGERTPAEIAAAVPADPTVVAHHLRFLLDARLVRRHRHGRRVHYALRDAATGRLVEEVLRYSAGE